jgi:ubiquinone/menaquinone biosynthesis C-methylase UbiE
MDTQIRNDLKRAFGRPHGFYGAVAALTMAVENRAPNQAVVDHLAFTGEEHVLEIGCGPGAAARHAARQIGAAHAVTALDRAPVMLRCARALATVDRSPAVTWVEGVAEALPFERPQFTTVFAINNWHHWDDATAAVAEILRVLLPGGRIAIAQRTAASRHPGAHGAGSHALDAVRATLQGLGSTTSAVVRGSRDELEVFQCIPVA